MHTVYDPSIRARLGTAAYFCGAVVLKLRMGVTPSDWIASERQSSFSSGPAVRVGVTLHPLTIHICCLPLRVSKGPPFGPIHFSERQSSFSSGPTVGVGVWGSEGSRFSFEVLSLEFGVWSLGFEVWASGF